MNDERVGAAIQLEGNGCRIPSCRRSSNFILLKPPADEVRFSASEDNLPYSKVTNLSVNHTQKYLCRNTWNKICSCIWYHFPNKLHKTHRHRHTHTWMCTYTHKLPLLHLAPTQTLKLYLIYSLNKENCGVMLPLSTSQLSCKYQSSGHRTSKVHSLQCRTSPWCEIDDNERHTDVGPCSREEELFLCPGIQIWLHRLSSDLPGSSCLYLPVLGFVLSHTTCHTDWGLSCHTRLVTCVLGLSCHMQLVTWVLGLSCHTRLVICVLGSDLRPSCLSCRYFTDHLQPPNSSF